MAVFLFIWGSIQVSKLNFVLIPGGLPAFLTNAAVMLTMGIGYLWYYLI